MDDVDIMWVPNVGPKANLPDSQYIVMCSSITTIIIIIYYRPTTTATTITSPGPSTSTKGKGGVWVGACTPRSTK